MCLQNRCLILEILENKVQIGGFFVKIFKGEDPPLDPLPFAPECLCVCVCVCVCGGGGVILYPCP